ncbi:MAG: DUF885 domain-containing protein [Chloroflexi bacterium]|nr:DUF885 domain-containing protein [Chloroflexota bacterium]
MAQRIFLFMILFVGLLVVAACEQTADITEEVESPTTVPQPPPTETAVKVADTPTAVPELPAKLPLDEFYDIVLHDILTRDPELATSLSLPGTDNADLNGRLTNESPAYQDETIAILEQHLAALRSYDLGEQTAEQRISTAVLDYYLTDIIRRDQFRYYDYRMSPIFGLPWQFPNLMTAEHPLTNRADAEAYISRLNQFNDKADQVIAGLELAEEQGALPPQWMFGWAINDLQNSSSGPTQNTVFYRHFVESVAMLGTIPEDEKEALYDQVETAVTQNIIPGYQKLITFLQEQSGRANNDDGAWKHPNGEAYYQAALRHHTTTDLTANEIHEIGLAEVTRIQVEMQTLLNDLGYAADFSWPQVMQQVDRDSGSISGVADIVAEYERLIAEAETAVTPHFDLLPQAELIVDTVPGGTAYYLTPALDGSRPGVFYTVAGSGPKSRLRMPTTAYHEAIPGHHFQIALQGEMEGLPTFRNVTLFNAYAEGWALYAEQLAAEIGLYDDDPYGDLGRLQMELFRAARLVVDTGIHAKGWTRQEAIDYMIENTGLPQQWVQFEVSRYIVWPGQAASYKIGQLKILELRDLAQQELGDKFKLREFHNIVLQNGALPLPILETVIEEYIATNR